MGWMSERKRVAAVLLRCYIKEKTLIKYRGRG